MDEEAQAIITELRAQNEQIRDRLKESDAEIEKQDQQLLKVNADNRTLTNALQRIEAGDKDPREIARSVLDSPSHKALYG